MRPYKREFQYQGSKLWSLLNSNSTGYRTINVQIYILFIYICVYVFCNHILTVVWHISAVVVWFTRLNKKYQNHVCTTNCWFTCTSYQSHTISYYHYVMTLDDVPCPLFLITHSITANEDAHQNCIGYQACALFITSWGCCEYHYYFVTFSQGVVKYLIYLCLCVSAI